MIETGSGTHNVAPQPATRSHRAGWIVLGVLLGLALVIGGTAGAVALQRDPVTPTALPGEPVVAPQEAARLAACDFARAMATYHYSDLGPYFDSMKAGTTGTMHDDFATSTDSLRQMMEPLGSTSAVVGEPECLVRSGAGDEYVIVVFLTTHRTSFTDPVGMPQKTTFALTMRKVGVRWLCAQADPM
ncbi:hypothetical protein [Nocardia rosealba]|uniref:hypothetical protein n=1 Tax=Nocardia TaxID=1817 RepID=UPI001CD9B2AB|nr:hypothetical protein [Nocardia rosealba]MCA2210024.1 hypothetical protein [Nocardia rosealba]